MKNPKSPDAKQKAPAGTWPGQTFKKQGEDAAVHFAGGAGIVRPAEGFTAPPPRPSPARPALPRGHCSIISGTKEDLALYFLERELDAIIQWYEHDQRIQKAALPEKLFAVTHRFLDRLAPYEEFIGAVYLRALAPASKLGPWSLQTRERNLRYLRFIRGILEGAEEAGEIPQVGDFGAYAFGLFHLACHVDTLAARPVHPQGTNAALLDRCLNPMADIS